MVGYWPRVRAGFSEGIQVFLTYAAAEYVFLTTSLVVRSHRVMLIQQWRGTVVLFAAYMLLGMLAGGVTALLSGRLDPDRQRLRKTLILTVVGAFMLNAMVCGLSIPSKTALVSATGVIAAAVFFELGSGTRPRGLAAEPMVVFGVLVVTSWVLLNTKLGGTPPIVRVLAGVGLGMLFVLLAVPLHRVLAWVEERYSQARLIEHGLKVATAVLLCCSPILISSWAEGREPAWPRPRHSKSPNIVLITLDTVNTEHMGIYGYHRANTPNLQALLNQSTLYTNFIAASAITLTSHASIFTGLYPQAHGAYKEFNRFETGRPLSSRIPTMAQVLARNGYRTMAVVANRYYLNDEFGTLRGFQFVDWMAPVALVTPDRDYLLRNRLREVMLFDRVVQDLDNTTLPAAEVNERAANLLDKASDQSSPFFLFLNYCDAHYPYLPPPPYSSKYPGRDLGFSLKTYFHTMNMVNVHNNPLPPEARAHLISQYDGAIGYLDQKVGEVIQRLKDNGEYDQTMIIVTSDHGEAFGERNLVFHDAAVYQDEVHVPLVIKYPGQKSAERVDAVTSHVDLMPTILNIVGIQPPAPLQGVDLRNAAAASRIVVSELHGSASYDGPRFDQIEYAVYSWPFKMIYSTNGMRELYDLSSDPLEHNNLFRLEAPITADLRNKLVNWSFHTTPQYMEPGPANRDVEDRLKSLGYAHQGVE